jgi:hypothetical protein
MLFCFFWSGQFILALGQIVFAMAGELFVFHYWSLLHYPEPPLSRPTYQLAVVFRTQLPSGTSRGINRLSEIQQSWLAYGRRLFITPERRRLERSLLRS